MKEQEGTQIGDEDLEDWVNSFCAFDVEPPRERTFTEILGIQNKEVYASRLLGFFFDSNEYHGMKDLWMRSLLECIAEEGTKDVESSLKNIGDVSVAMEVSTDDKKRIDLVLYANSCAVAIEHKIDAGLYNELNEYADKVAREAKKLDIKRVYHVVLAKNGDKNLLEELENGKKKENPDWTLNDEWIVVSHKDLFEKVRQNIGGYLGSADLKCIALMNDFMDGICPPPEELHISQELFNHLQEGPERERIEDLADRQGKDDLLERYDKQCGRIRAKQNRACESLKKYMEEELKKLEIPSIDLGMDKFPKKMLLKSTKPFYYSVHFTTGRKDGLPPKGEGGAVYDVETSFDGRNWYVTSWCRKKPKAKDDKDIEAAPDKESNEGERIVFDPGDHKSVLHKKIASEADNALEDVAKAIKDCVGLLSDKNLIGCKIKWPEDHRGDETVSQKE